MAPPKIPITITYRHAGTQPPIFLAGEFSDPPWDPQEMEYTTNEDGEHTFTKEVLAAAGSQVQYKFRVGIGDWWVLNEESPTATDAGGFLNNVAQVPSAPETSTTEPSSTTADTDSAKPKSDSDTSTNPNENADTTAPKDSVSENKPLSALANAAKEIRYRKDYSSSGVSTPDFVRTAAEVADSAALLDKEDESASETPPMPPVANAAKSLMGRKDPRSGSRASTPDFVRTTVEVADSAALLDKEEPETVSESKPQSALGNAAKELRYRKDLHSSSGTSTPDFVRTTEEVADSAALLDKEDVEDDPQSKPLPWFANAAKEILSRNDPHTDSGASTPSFVRTAAEVADSAALLDKEEAEAEVPDEEAGRTGYRRLSATPIPEVASTAAEVADTAQRLDSGTLPSLEVPPAMYEDIDPYGFDEPLPSEANKAPLFAHECVGMVVYEDDNMALSPYDDELSHFPDYTEDIDMNDPTLERFPSNRDEIIDRVRKLEGGLNEDHADVEGLVPPSPVVGPSGPQNHDRPGDFFVSSPVLASPVATRSRGMLGLPRGSLGSVSSERSSVISLDSISEAAEEATADEYYHPPPVISAPTPRGHSSLEETKSPGSDEDEGIVMKRGNDKSRSSTVSGAQTPAVADVTPRVRSPENPAQADHDQARPEVKLVAASEDSRTQTPEPSRTENGAPAPSSPRIVIQLAEEIEQATRSDETTPADHTPTDAAAQSAEETEQTTRSDEMTPADHTPTDTAKSTGTDTGAQSQVKRRMAPPDRVATPTSIHETGIKAAKSGNWIRSFFRTVFVDWIGGFITRLCGGRRETLLAAGAAAVFVGAAWWKTAGKER